MPEGVADGADAIIWVSSHRQQGLHRLHGVLCACSRPNAALIEPASSKKSACICEIVMQRWIMAAHHFMQQSLQVGCSSGAQVLRGRCI